MDPNRWLTRLYLLNNSKAAETNTT